jgi:hypothetical protein
MYLKGGTLTGCSLALMVMHWSSNTEEAGSIPVDRSNYSGMKQEKNVRGQLTILV